MNQRKWGSIISYLQMVLGIVVSLVYTPFMIRILGQSEFGLYNTVVSTISMMAILSLGFNSSYIRYYAKYAKDKALEKIYQLNGLFMIIFLIIGFIALCCGIYISYNLDVVFKDGLTLEEYELARILFILLTFNMAISFPMSVFTNIISAHERFVFLKLMGICKTVFSPLVTLPLLLMGYRSIAVVAVTIIISVITDASYIFYTFFKLRVRFIFRDFNKCLFKDLLIYTSFIAINIVVDQINWNIGRVILARYQGTIAVAVYSVGYLLNNYYCMVSTSVSGVFTPYVHRIINETNQNQALQRKNLTELFVKVGRIQFLIMALFATGLVFFGKQFIACWAGQGYEDSYYVVLLLALPATIPLIQNLGIEIQRALNKHQFRSIVYLIMALINIVLAFFLCQKFGVVGCAIGTAISLIIANGIIMNIYYHKECNIDILKFWHEILSMSKGLIIPICIGIFVFIDIKTNSIIQLLFYIISYIAIYSISIYNLSMNNYEKGLLKDPVIEVLQRCKGE